jgi:hypothetical protein
VAVGSTWARAEVQAPIEKAKKVARSRFINRLSINAFPSKSEASLEADTGAEFCSTNKARGDEFQRRINPDRGTWSSGQCRRPFPVL